VRIELSRATLDMAQARPAMGWGMGSWSAVYPAHARFDDGVFDNHAHNDWAEWFSDGGIPFLAAMCVMGAAAVTAAWRTGWAMGLAFVLLHCLIEYHFQERPVFGALYFGMAGLTRGHYYSSRVE
jgi:O-antigen ligase